MAPPLPGSRQTAQRGNLLRSIIITILALMVLFGIVVFITWLVIRPKKLIYTVEDGKIHGFDLHDNHLNASFYFVLNARNPNHKAALYYDSIEVSVSYDHETLAFGHVEPFFQPRRNVTRIEMKPTANYTSLSGPNFNDLKLEKSSGDIELTIRLKARIRFKVGSWKSWHYKLRVLCSSVEVHLESARAFKRTQCKVDI